MIVLYESPIAAGGWPQSQWGRASEAGCFTFFLIWSFHRIKRNEGRLRQIQIQCDIISILDWTYKYSIPDLGKTILEPKKRMTMTKLNPPLLCSICTWYSETRKPEQELLLAPHCHSVTLSSEPTEEKDWGETWVCMLSLSRIGQNQFSGKLRNTSGNSKCLKPQQPWKMILLVECWSLRQPGSYVESFHFLVRVSGEQTLTTKHNDR